MTKDDLIKGLNEDLAGELGTVIRYTYQAAHCFGVIGLELREMFQRETEDEIGHARYLSDVVVDLGGSPTTTPKTFRNATGLEEMLQIDEEMELADVKAYVQHAEWAEQLGHVELKLHLEEMAADEAGHAREIRRILKGIS